jgi:hypothetical protein
MQNSDINKVIKQISTLIFFILNHDYLKVNDPELFINGLSVPLIP